MKPKPKGSFKDYIKKLEGKPERELLPNGFYVGERVYFKNSDGSRYYGSVTNNIPDSMAAKRALDWFTNQEVVWVYWDSGRHWFNMVRDTYHEE